MHLKLSELSRRIIRFAVIAFVITGFVFIAITSGYQIVSSPELCAACHRMKPYYNSWEKSDHSTADCYSCHAESKPKLESDQPKEEQVVIPRYMLTTNKAVRAFGKTIDVLSEYVRKIYDYTREKKNKLAVLTAMTGDSNKVGQRQAWANCINCHGDLLYSPDGNDYYGHFEHTRSGVITCKECHGDLVHGQKLKVTRKNCLECHDQKIDKPSSHDVPTFKTSHGRDYLTKKNCSMCHTQGIKESLCQQCHQVSMPHPDDFREQHIPAIAKIGTRVCFSCHEQNLTPDQRAQEPKNQEPTSQEQPGDVAACSKCHGQKMPHGKDILKTHTSLAKKQGIKNCNYCHQTSPQQKDMAVACNNCHGLEMPHPQDIKYQHKYLYYAKGQAACNLCHSPANQVSPGAPWTRPNFCTECHMKNKPHQPGYNIQHQLGGYERNSCNICHPAVIHCNECHYGE